MAGPLVAIMSGAGISTDSGIPEPNAAHRAIAGLERSGVAVRVITQNVDGLHQRAGTSDRKVLELHGSTQSVVRTACGAQSPTPDDDLAGEVIREPIGTALPRVLTRLQREFTEGSARS